MLFRYLLQEDRCTWIVSIANMGAIFAVVRSILQTGCLIQEVVHCIHSNLSDARCVSTGFADLKFVHGCREARRWLRLYSFCILLYVSCGRRSSFDRKDYQFTMMMILLHRKKQQRSHRPASRFEFLVNTLMFHHRSTIQNLGVTIPSANISD